MAYNVINYFSRKTNKRLLIIVLLVAVIAAVYLLYSPKVYERALPELTRAYIVTRLEGEDIARNSHRTCLQADYLIMHALIEAKGSTEDEKIYFSEYDKIELDGIMIPDNRLDKWDIFWKELKVAWIKIEPYFHKYDGKGKNDLAFVKWKHRWRFDGMFYWSLPADAKPTEIIEYEVSMVRDNKKARFSDTRNYTGTMFFQIYANIYGEESMLTPIREAYSPGDETAGPEGLSKDVMRITVISDRSFTGYCTGFMNLAYVEGNEDLIYKTKATQNYFAISNRSYIYEAAILAGYDLKDRTLEGLRNACTVVARNLIRRAGNHVYNESDEYINFDDAGVRPGDIIVIGKEKRMAVLVSDGGMKAKPNGILDGTDVILYTGENGLEKTYLAYAVDDVFEVWRLNKKKTDGK